MEKKNCLGCYWVSKIPKTEDRYRCWEEPGVCDHAYVQTEQEAEKYYCRNWISKEKKFCRNCRFKVTTSYCSCVKNAKIENDFVTLKLADDMSEICKFFETEKAEE